MAEGTTNAYHGKYVLDAARQPVAEPDLYRWAEWFENSDAARRVALSTVGKWRISTVFLTIDHGFGRGAPVLWETMVFGPEPWGDWQDRYTSREAAEAGHQRVLDAITRGESPDALEG